MMGANLVMHNRQKIYVIFVPFESFAFIGAFCTIKGESSMSLLFVCFFFFLLITLEAPSNDYSFACFSLSLLFIHCVPLFAFHCV